MLGKEERETMKHFEILRFMFDAQTVVEKLV
jgi:hypothetical protein